MYPQQYNYQNGAWTSNSLYTGQQQYALQPGQYPQQQATTFNYPGQFAQPYGTTLNAYGQQPVPYSQHSTTDAANISQQQHTALPQQQPPVQQKQPPLPQQPHPPPPPPQQPHPPPPPPQQQAQYGQVEQQNAQKFGQPQTVPVGQRGQTQINSNYNQNNQSYNAASTQQQYGMSTHQYGQHQYNPYTNYEQTQNSTYSTQSQQQYEQRTNWGQPQSNWSQPQNNQHEVQKQDSQLNQKQQSSDSPAKLQNQKHSQWGQKQKQFNPKQNQWNQNIEQNQQSSLQVQNNTSQRFGQQFTQNQEPNQLWQQSNMSSSLYDQNQPPNTPNHHWQNKQQIIHNQQQTSNQPLYGRAQNPPSVIHDYNYQNQKKITSQSFGEIQESNYQSEKNQQQHQNKAINANKQQYSGQNQNSQFQQNTFQKQNTGNFNRFKQPNNFQENLKSGPQPLMHQNITSHQLNQLRDTQNHFVNRKPDGDATSETAQWVRTPQEEQKKQESALVANTNQIPSSQLLPKPSLPSASRASPMPSETRLIEMQKISKNEITTSNSSKLSVPPASLPSYSLYDTTEKEESLASLTEQLETLETQIRTYQADYQKWYEEFVQWQKQHQNHPDQKQYIDYQKKYQKMIEDQQKQLKEQYADLQKKINDRKAQTKTAGAAKIAALDLSKSHVQKVTSATTTITTVTSTATFATNAKETKHEKAKATTSGRIMLRPANEYIGVKCKFFPKCKRGNECKFEHPMCSTGKTCVDSGCLFEHPPDRDMVAVKANEGSTEQFKVKPNTDSNTMGVVSGVIENSAKSTLDNVSNDPVLTRKRELTSLMSNFSAESPSKLPKIDLPLIDSVLKSRVTEVYEKRKREILGSFGSIGSSFDEEYQRRRKEILGIGNPGSFDQEASSQISGNPKLWAAEPPVNDEKNGDKQGRPGRPLLVERGLVGRDLNYPPERRLPNDSDLPLDRVDLIRDRHDRPFDRFDIPPVDRRSIDWPSLERAVIDRAPVDRSLLNKSDIPSYDPYDRPPLDRIGRALDRPYDRLYRELDRLQPPHDEYERRKREILGDPLRDPLPRDGLPLRDRYGSDLLGHSRDLLSDLPERRELLLRDSYRLLNRDKYSDIPFDSLLDRVRDIPYRLPSTEVQSIDYDHGRSDDLRIGESRVRETDPNESDIYGGRRVHVERGNAQKKDDTRLLYSSDNRDLLEKHREREHDRDRSRDLLDRSKELYDRKERDNRERAVRSRESSERRRDSLSREDRHRDRVDRHRDYDTSLSRERRDPADIMRRIEERERERNERDGLRDYEMLYERDNTESISSVHSRKVDESRIPESELKPEIFSAADLFDMPGRQKRPANIVIILRGIPGSGKSHIARLIKDKEAYYGAQPPRILALADYFMQEVEREERLPGQTKPTKVKKQEYVFEPEMEDIYRASLLKAFNKTLNDGFFPMVIVDAINNKNSHYDQFWSDAKHKGFEVFIAEITGDITICTERSSKRSKDEVELMLKRWEKPPVYYKRLDVSSLLQDAAIDDVEMEEAQYIEASQDEPSAKKDEEVDEDLPTTFHIPTSKWETKKAETLAKLDGFMKKRSKSHSSPAPDEDDEEDDPYGEKEADMRLGKKRVRWADIERKKQIDHQRKIGFSIGMDWKILTDPNAEIPK